jgi:hypothetical protein
MTPGLDYKTSVRPPAGNHAAAFASFYDRPVPASFYDGGDDRRLVECPDCHKKADALFRDHGGDCIPGSPVFAYTRPSQALTIIRREAMRRPVLSANELRDLFDLAGVEKSSRGPAFTIAQRRGWLAREASTPSTDDATKGHRLQTYRSCLFREAVA